MKFEIHCSLKTFQLYNSIVVIETLLFIQKGCIVHLLLPIEHCYSLRRMTSLALVSGLWGFLGGSVVTNPPARQEVRVQSLGWEDALEKEMATHNKNIWTVKQG